MGQTFKRGSKDVRFDDGYEGYEYRNADLKKEKKRLRREKAKEKRYIKEEE